MSPLKILLAVIALAVLLATAAIVAALLLFDPNEYREEIANVVYAETGRTLSIDGGLYLRVLPCCAVALDDGRLSNPPGFEAEDFASVDSIRLGIRLWPLLTEQSIVIEEIAFDGLTVNLVQRADGAANWEFGAESVTTEPETDTSDGAALPELSIDGVRIANASLRYRDEAAGTDLRIDELNVTTGPLSIGEAFDVETAFVARDLASGAAVRGTLNTTVMVAADAGSAEFTGLHATADITTPELSGGGLNLVLDNDVLRYDIESGNVEFNGIRVTADVSASELPDGGLNLALEGAAARLDGASGAVGLEGFVATLSAAGVKLTAHIDGTVGADGMALSGQLQVPTLAPRDLLSRLGEPPVETADPAALGSLQFDADWSLDDVRLEVTSLDLRLDDTRVTGRAGMNYMDQSRVSFDIGIDTIDLDRYLAPVEEGDDAAPARGTQDDELPVEMLRSLDLKGRITIAALQAGGLSLQDVAATIEVRNGVLSVDPSTAKVYEGTYNGTLRLDASGSVPTVRFTQRLEKVQAGGMLSDLFDAQNLSGLLRVNIEAEGAGGTTGQLTRSLKGSVSMDLDDAVYEGVDVWYEIRKAVALLKGKPAPAPSAVQQTEITTLTFAGKLADGMLRSEQLVAEIPFIRLEGSGLVSLVDDSLDYRLKARVLSRPDFPDADDLADLQRITIPLTVTGTTTDPVIGVDVAELAKDAAVQKVKNRLLEKLGLGEPEDTGDEATDGTETEKSDSTRDLLKRGLRDLFGN